MFHKFLPKSSVQMLHWISARFFEMATQLLYTYVQRYNAVFNLRIEASTLSLPFPHIALKKFTFATVSIRSLSPGSELTL